MANSTAFANVINFHLLILLTDGCYQEIAGSRAIGPYLDPDNTRSKSFTVFVAGVRKMVDFQ
jgi:hypothetical protein